MLTPTSPIIRGFEGEEIIIAKDQPEYLPLPALPLSDGSVVTRWKLSPVQRLIALVRGDIYLTVLTFHRALQPVMLDVCPPQIIAADAKTQD